ncbi:MAG: hypothetical protein ACREQV_21890 [Candidatus Binatia bacterium]
MSVGHIAAALPLIAAVVAARLPVRDNSYLWHVRAGSLQIDLGRVLTEDPFSFTALGRSWRTQSWLADLAYGWGDHLWGLAIVTPIVTVGTVVLVAAIACRCYRAVRAPLMAAIATTWIMWLTIGYFTPRPVLFSLGLLAVFLLSADEPRLRWTLPLLMWVWSSVHGGFIVGIGYLVLDGLRRRDRQRLLDVAAVIVPTLLTAHGWGTWEVLIKFLGNGEALDLIVEWLTPNLISFELFPFALAIVALLVGAIRGRLVPPDLWVIVPFLLFAFTANRAVPLAALALAPWIVADLGAWRITRAPSTTRSQGVINGVLLASIFVLPWALPLEGGLDQDLFAVEAIRHLEPERAFHDDAVGGYLIYAEWPKRLVYIDDRAELYEDQFVDFVKARNADPVWREVFERFQIHQALLKKENPLTEVLLESGWSERFSDDEFVVLADQST